MSQLIVYFFTIIFFIILFNWVFGAPQSIKISKGSLSASQSKSIVTPAADDETEEDDEPEDEDEDDKAGEEDEVDEANDIFYDDLLASAKKLTIMPSSKSNGQQIRFDQMKKIFILIFLFSMHLF